MTLQSSVPAASAERTAPAPDQQGNGTAASSFVRPSRLPKARRVSRLMRFILPATAVVLAVIAGGVWFFWFRGPQVRTDIEKRTVEYQDLQLKVVERGALEAKENRDIKCEVKTGSRGAPKIKWVVDNGAQVKKGDLLVEIDDSYLQEQALAKKIDRLNAEKDRIAAEQTYPQKKIAIGLAEKNLEKWIKGDYPQSLHDLEGQIQTAESNLLQEEDRTSWVARMVKKKYMTASQEEAEQALLMGNKLALQKVQEQKKVLTDYTDPVNRQTFENAIKQANVDERTALADMESKRAVYQQQDLQYKDLLDQITQCKVYAEHTGIVVYSLPEQTRTGSGSSQSIIAQGEPVQYGQKMMSIPDLSHMLVNVRIHEASINQMEVQARLEAITPDGPADKAGLKTGDVIIKLGPKAVKTFADVTDALRGHKPEDTIKVKVLRDKEEHEAELTLAPRAAPQPGVASNPGGRGGAGDPNHAFGVQFQEGLPATVRVDAVQGKTLKAHVKSVANVASPQDWMAPDVKVYQAYVEIDDNVDLLKLKPGLSAVCTIFTETRAEHVLAVPVQVVLNPLEKGGKPRCFVLTARGPESREVDLGMKDEIYAEIKSGVEEGETIIMNPRTMLSDKEKKAAKESEKALPGTRKPTPGGAPPVGGTGDPKGKPPGAAAGSGAPPATGGGK